MFSADLGGAAPASAPAATDPPFQKVALLLHGDGTNGAQNNTFVDSSTNNFTITRTGNVAQGTFSPFSLAEGQWSNYFDGSGDYLTVTNNTALQFGTGDFTVEGWFYHANLSGYSSLFSIGQYDSGILVRAAGSGFTGDIYINGTQYGLNWNSGSAFKANQWNHLALVRSGTSVNLYVGGVSIVSFTNSANIAQTVNTFIGVSSHSTTEIFTGYISNFRLVKGTAVYTTNFTPPTSALTAISGTSLLTCQSNRFKDNSSNNFTITPYGDTKVTAFSPLAPSAAYSASTNGGSGYFDGTGDYLTTSSTITLTGDYTLECWFYQNAKSTNYVPIIESDSGTYNFPLILDYNNTGFLGFYLQSGSPTATTGVKVFELNTWNHVAAVRSGSNYYVYVNGNRVINTTGSVTSLSVDKIGGYSASGYLLNGYISNVRVTNTAVYTGSTYTVPTAPLTAITNTQLLLNCTNAGIIDNAGKNDIETVGNAQISTSVKKYGTGSMYFDGSGDYLNAPDRPEHQLGTGVFTIECWVYLTTNGISQNIAGKGGVGTDGWTIVVNVGNSVSFISTNAITSVGKLATNTWYHIAIVRTGTGTNQTTIYINGSADGVGTVPTDLIQTNPMRVGSNKAGSGGYFTGYIDDLRITKGQALYTSNFTPPTQAFPNV